MLPRPQADSDWLSDTHIPRCIVRRGFFGGNHMIESFAPGIALAIVIFAVVVILGLSEDMVD